MRSVDSIIYSKDSVSDTTFMPSEFTNLESEVTARASSMFYINSLLNTQETHSGLSILTHTPVHPLVMSQYLYCSLLDYFAFSFLTEGSDSVFP